MIIMSAIYCITSCGPVEANISKEPLREGSFEITIPGKRFSDWSKEDHRASCQVLQKITEGAKRAGLFDQYLVVAKVDSEEFRWEVVPYPKSVTVFDRMARQLAVLWRATFGASPINEEQLRKQVEIYRSCLEESCKPEEEQLEPEDCSAGIDPFCKKEVIERQQVLKGERVNVLLSRAPIGYGGEKLHFLIVPAQHDEFFSSMPEETYAESLLTAEKIVEYFSRHRTNVHSVYVLHKNGIDAGQSVPHWHLHVIILTQSTQDFWGRITMARNILFGSRNLSDTEFDESVIRLRNELTAKLD